MLAIVAQLQKGVVKQIYIRSHLSHDTWLVTSTCWQLAACSRLAMRSLIAVLAWVKMMVHATLHEEANDGLFVCQQ